MAINEYIILQDEEQLLVRLSWCYGIRSKLCRSNINDGNNQELWKIINDTIDSAYCNPLTKLRYAPSLLVPEYGTMTVGNIKKVLNVYGPMLFGCQLQNDDSHKIETMFAKEDGPRLIKKPKRQIK